MDAECKPRGYRSLDSIFLPQRVLLHAQRPCCDDVLDADLGAFAETASRDEGRRLSIDDYRWLEGVQDCLAVCVVIVVVVVVLEIVVPLGGIVIIPSGIVVPVRLTPAEGKTKGQKQGSPRGLGHGLLPGNQPTWGEE